MSAPAPSLTDRVTELSEGFLELISLAPLPPCAKFDNRPTWVNNTPAFDNKATWDNWNKK
ncbi:multiple cyclophane-containing RiPP AmcA [Streptomyces sp. 5.8]|uniref:multiple cyclophane-containing RiPP AmcA n=1 Tax=Streptomyces sp. 5.8 TaxID=3406571 RepID=UPI003BB6C5B7